MHSRCSQIVTILENLGLSEKLDDYTGDLSGGEQKRLLIALELVDDPMILFLDEPTTGLDSSSSTQCIQLMRSLANEGKTIICTIHTPSALLFAMFDHVYALADGCCIYQGPPSCVTSFLGDLELNCPETFNPADFLLEIANGDYGELNQRLTEQIQNGLNCASQVVEQKSASLSVEKLTSSHVDDNFNPKRQFFSQLRQLLIRNFLVTSRDRTLSLMRLLIHLIMALFIGVMYNGIGNDAANIFNIYKFLFFNIFILMFTAFSSLQTSCELNLECEAS